MTNDDVRVDNNVRVDSDVIVDSDVRVASDNGSDASEFYSGERFKISGRSEGGSWSSSERRSAVEEASKGSGAGSLSGCHDNQGFVEDDGQISGGSGGSFVCEL